MKFLTQELESRNSVVILKHPKAMALLRVDWKMPFCSSDDISNNVIIFYVYSRSRFRGGGLCKEDGERFKASPSIYNTNCTIHSSKGNSHPNLPLPFFMDLNGQPKSHSFLDINKKTFQLK